MTAFARMYEAHTAREDTVIFPEFKKTIGPKTYHELGEPFEEIENREFGGDGFDMALDHVSRTDRTLRLSDLPMFTPTPPPPAFPRRPRLAGPPPPTPLLPP